MSDNEQDVRSDQEQYNEYWAGVDTRLLDEINAINLRLKANEIAQPGSKSFTRQLLQPLVAMTHALRDGAESIATIMGFQRIQASASQELAESHKQIANSSFITSSYALSQLGLVDVQIDEKTGAVEVRRLTPEEQAERAQQGRTTRYIPGEVSTRWGGQGEAIAWVFKAPKPYDDVEIACAPDDAMSAGMRCTATRKLVGGEREQFIVHLLTPDESKIVDDLWPQLKEDR